MEDHSQVRTYIATQQAVFYIQGVDMCLVSWVQCHCLHVDEYVAWTNFRWQSVVDQVHFAGLASQDEGFHGGFLLGKN